MLWADSLSLERYGVEKKIRQYLEGGGVSRKQKGKAFQARKHLGSLVACENDLQHCKIT